MYRQLYLVDTQLGVKHLLLIILDARFVRLQKSNHAEARDASFLIITYRLRVLARAKEYITHQEPIYVKLLPIFVATRGLAPPKPLFNVDTFVVSGPYCKSEIRISCNIQVVYLFLFATLPIMHFIITFPSFLMSVYFFLYQVFIRQ